MVLWSKAAWGIGVSGYMRLQFAHATAHAHAVLLSWRVCAGGMARVALPRGYVHTLIHPLRHPMRRVIDFYKKQKVNPYNREQVGALPVS